MAMTWDWSGILKWAAKHAPDLPAFVTLVLSVVRAQGVFARMKAVGLLYAALQEILADFPMPANQDVVGPFTASGSLHDHVCAAGVSAADAAEFCESIDCVA